MGGASRHAEDLVGGADLDACVGSRPQHNPFCYLGERARYGPWFYRLAQATFIGLWWACAALVTRLCPEGQCPYWFLAAFAVVGISQLVCAKRGVIDQMIQGAKDQGLDIHAGLEKSRMWRLLGGWIGLPLGIAILCLILFVLP
jgi:hypothetical protein